SAKWPIHLDIADVEIGRYCFLGSKFIVRPSLGLRTAWLDQKLNITYLSKGGVTLTSRNHSYSWGIGPRGALGTSWNLYKGLQLFGNFGVSILQVNDHIKCVQHNP